MDICKSIKNKEKKKPVTNIKDHLQLYVKNNEVVYQLCGELVEVSNETEKENKNTLLSYFNRANHIYIYDKHDSFIQEDWARVGRMVNRQ